MRTALLALAAFSAFAAPPPELELKDASGARIIKYAIELPDSVAPANTADPAKQLGLILCFPEHDRPVGDEIYPVREALKRLGLRNQFILLSAGPKERKFGPQDHEPIFKLIEWAKRTFPINPRRVFMYGKGEGGKLAGELAMFHPKKFTASISYSWSWWKFPVEIEEPINLDQSAEFYMVLGLRDLSYHLTNVRDGYSRVAAKGYKVIYREFPELGARTYHQPSNDDAIAWATRLRSKTLPLSSAEAKLLAAPSVNADGYYGNLALVGGVQAGEVLKKLLESKDAAVRTAAAETFSHGIFSETANAALGARLSDSSSAVRRAAVRALAMHANWRSRAAQESLTRHVLNPESVDRVAAADALVHAARYQIRGVRQDPSLFQALIMLLEDKDEELRTIAANTLMPIRDPEFRGDIGRPEKKAPEGGWTTWLEHVTARADGYYHGYRKCGAPSSEAETLYCEGGKLLQSNPKKALELTLRAAAMGHHPAEAMSGILLVIGKGAEQNNAEGAKWLAKAAEAGDSNAIFNAAMLYNGSPGLRADKPMAEKFWKMLSAVPSSN